MKVKDYLRSLGFTEAPAVAINTIVKGPQAMQFCSECQLGERKADVVVRLHDTPLMAIECKVSNSATNSVKRLNNDAAVKAEYWIKQFGSAQVVPVAALVGVFKVLNLNRRRHAVSLYFGRMALISSGRSSIRRIETSVWYFSWHQSWEIVSTY